MPVTLDNALYVAAVLQERLATHSTPELRQKKEAADFVAFGLFKERTRAIKQAGLGDAASGVLNAMKGPAAWGLGLGIPAWMVGKSLINNARDAGKDVVHDARNQALLTALGVGGMQAVGQGIGSFFNKDPRKREEIEQFQYPDGTTGSAQRTLKLSAILLLDDVIEDQLSSLEGEEKVAAEELLRENRTYGMQLLLCEK